jgi:single-strand DNA-binding protein
MTGEPITTIIGNLTSDPELRFTPSGAAVANFTVASTPRRKDGDEWVDGEAMFVSCSVWREYAENVAESLQKGQRVIVHGRLKVRSYETRDQEKRLSIELDVEEVGHALRFGSATFERKGANTQGRAPQTQSRRPSSGVDPWAGQSAQRSTPTRGDDPWSGQSANPYREEPPF